MFIKFLLYIRFIRITVSGPGGQPLKTEQVCDVKRL